MVIPAKNLRFAKAKIEMGTEGDVSIARTGDGEVTISAKKIIVGGYDLLDLLGKLQKALDGKGNSGGGSPLAPDGPKMKNCMDQKEFAELIFPSQVEYAHFYNGGATLVYLDGKEKTRSNKHCSKHPCSIKYVASYSGSTELKLDESQGTSVGAIYTVSVR